MKKLLFSLILSLLPIASGAIQYEYFNPLMPQNGALKVNQTIGQLTPPQGKGFGVLSALTNLQSVASSIATNEYGIQVDTLGLVCPTEEAVVAAISAHNTNQSAHSYIQNRITVNDNAIAANADAIQKTRDDFIAADSEIHQILNSHAGELTTLHNDIDDLGDEVAVIEGKIPESTTSSNQLVNASQLAAEEQDIRDDMNQADSELQTQITAQAGAITTLRNDIDDLGDEVAGIEGKIPSGASTSNLLATNSQINTLSNRISAEETSRQNADTLLQASINSGLALKLDKAQGVENNGKILTVGADGQITLSSAPGSGLLSVNHDSTLTGAGTDVSPLGIASSVLSELSDKADQTVVDALGNIVSAIQTDYVSKTTQNAQTIASSLQAPELTVGTSQGTLNMSITAGVATIATNNGLDIISQTKFDTQPTTDDTTSWANATSATLVRKGQVADAVAAASAASMPTGTLIPFAGTTCPSGFIVANGGAVSRTTYANLFAVIGTTYGAGDGNSTFNLPQQSVLPLGTTATVSVYGNGKTVVFTSGTQYGALRQGGSAINPNTSSGATSVALPATNSSSSQFSNNVLLGITTNPANSGLTGSVNLANATGAKAIVCIKY